MDDQPPHSTSRSRKAFLLRVDATVMEAIERWADDDLRSVNAHIEYLLRQALARAGRTVRRSLPTVPPESSPAGSQTPHDKLSGMPPS